MLNSVTADWKGLSFVGSLCSLFDQIMPHYYCGCHRAPAARPVMQTDRTFLEGGTHAYFLLLIKCFFFPLLVAHNCATAYFVPPKTSSSLSEDTFHGMLLLLLLFMYGSGNKNMCVLIVRQTKCELAFNGRWQKIMNKVYWKQNIENSHELQHGCFFKI